MVTIHLIKITFYNISNSLPKKEKRKKARKKEGGREEQEKRETKKDNLL